MPRSISIARLLAEAYSDLYRKDSRESARRSFLDGWHGAAAGGTDGEAVRFGAAMRASFSGTRMIA